MSDASKAVFLSYASQDAEAARRIAEALRTAGVEVWFDADGGLEHGDEWDRKIRRQIKECVLFIPLVSANTQAREEGYFRLEWDLAAERARTIASGVAFILPVVIDGTKEPDALVPDRFRTVQWTKLPGGNVPPEVLQRFLKLWSHRTGVLAHQAKPEPATARPRPEERGEGAAAPGKSSRHNFAPALIGLGVIALIGLGVMFYRVQQHQAAVSRLHEVTLPEIERLIAAQDIAAAYALAEKAEGEIPGDSALQKRWPQLSVQATIDTTPAGAEVYVKEYRKPSAEWQSLGRTPLGNVRLPKVYTRWKIQKDGFAPLERTSGVNTKTSFPLDPAKTIPADMVRVAGTTTNENATGLAATKLDDFLIDRHEVTNRQFKEFVDRGGYTTPGYWQQPFTREGRALSREEAIAGFQDSTGRPGPATWMNGTYPENGADLPVTGLSWFEAAAYAEFAGKRLPSIYHWRAAAVIASVESVVPLSNFAGKGLAPVGSYQGMSACGAYDMAGNAKEWCWNAAGPDARYVLGGAWREPDYMFTQADAMSPFNRAETNGFRCMRLLGANPLSAGTDDELLPKTRNYAEEKPVSDEAFRVIRSLYSYDKTPLDSRVESTDDTDPRWRKEKVSFRAAYGGERIPAYVFLPRNSSPPYQAIIYFPGAGALDEKSSENLRDMNVAAVLVASGRALIYPVYKGTYERQWGESALVTWRSGSAAHRDWLIMLSKDLGRAIDYLETRPDIQPGKLAYLGNSWGGANGAILPALENRIKVSVLMIAGLYPTRALPEADQINFAPRVTMPTLMLNGRYDFRFPLETSQRPLFRLLGAPPDQKRHVLFDTGHALRPEQIASEAYTWLDRYLGVVK